MSNNYYRFFKKFLGVTKTSTTTEYNYVYNSSEYESNENDTSGGYSYNDGRALNYDDYHIFINRARRVIISKLVMT